MVDKYVYVTFEVTVQLSGNMEKNTSENRKKIRDEIYDRLYNGNRKLNYSCHIHNETIMSIIDEKGVEL